MSGPPGPSTRVARILAALAGSPAPMSTPQLVEELAEGLGGGQRVLTWYGNALRRQEAKGYVVMAGWTTGGWQHGQAATWRIADAGRARLAELLLMEPIR